MTEVRDLLQWEDEDRRSLAFLGRLCVGRVWWSNGTWYTKRFMDHGKGEHPSRLAAQDSLATEIARLIESPSS